MAKRSKKSSEKSSPTRDLIGFLLLAAGIFTFLAIFSYNPADPSWNTAIAGLSHGVHNYCGILGSYVADFFLQLFGYAAYLLPVAFFGCAFGVVFRPSLLKTVKPTVGFILLGVAATLLLELAYGGRESLPAWGGISGILLRSFLEAYIGVGGAIVLAGTMLVVSLLLTTRLSFQTLMDVLRAVWKGLSVVKSLALKAYAAVSDFVTILLTREEKEIGKGLDAIRKESVPKIPKVEKIRIGGKELAATPKGPEEIPKKKDEAAEIAKVVPIRMTKTKEQTQLPSFHSLDTSGSEEAVTAPKKSRHAYKLPDVEFLESPEDQELKINRNELFQNAQVLERKLKDFGVFGKVVEVQPGPVVTMYEFEPAPGVKVNQITRLNDDLALALKALSVRITPLPGKAVIGIEVANRERQVVYLKDIIANEVFGESSSKLSLAFGKDISGMPVTYDLRKMPHLLVAGATGSGKSVAINSMILSVLYKSTPDEVRMILVDPKMLELNFYDDIPHLLLPVVTEPRKASAALRWGVSEMERRYRLMADLGVRNIEGYNKKVGKEIERRKKNADIPSDELPLTDGQGNQAVSQSEKHEGTLPYLMIVIDELADLMMVSSREVEESIIRLAQMARAAGVHLILATQRPSVDVITGVIKANMPARVSFQVSSKTDSRTILDSNGAELLLGAGDMLFLPPGTSKLERVHGAFVTDHEVKRVTDFWKKQGKPDYNMEILRIQAEAEQAAQAGDGEDDEMYQQAINVVRTHRVASISMIQRKLRIGYNRAARIVERMEEEGLLQAGEVGKPREINFGRLDGVI